MFLGAAMRELRRWHGIGECNSYRRIARFSGMRAMWSKARGSTTTIVLQHGPLAEKAEAEVAEERRPRDFPMFTDSTARRLPRFSKTGVFAPRDRQSRGAGRG
jgi:hypothetical protein